MTAVAAPTTVAPHPAKHPARYSPTILDRLGVLLAMEAQGRGVDRLRVLDPFGGTGRVHLLGHDSVSSELEPEWAAQGLPLGPCLVADALALPFADGAFDAIVTSPCYGNRLADHHNARDSSVRHSYTHDLGRPLHPASAGTLQWGEPYRQLHRAAWVEALRVVAPGGLALVNVSDHVRRGVVVPVVTFHIEALEGAGWVIDHMETVPTPRLRYGANGAARVDGEAIVVARKPEEVAP